MESGCFEFFFLGDGLNWEIYDGISVCLGRICGWEVIFLMLGFPIGKIGRNPHKDIRIGIKAQILINNVHINT